MHEIDCFDLCQLIVIHISNNSNSFTFSLSATKLLFFWQQLFLKWEIYYLVATMYRPNSSFFFTWKGRQLWLSYSQNGAKVFTNSHLHSDGNLMAASDQLNTFFLSLWLVCCVTSQKVRKKVFNWSEVRLYRSNFLQNPYFNLLPYLKCWLLAFVLNHQ